MLRIGFEAINPLRVSEWEGSVGRWSSKRTRDMRREASHNEEATEHRQDNCAYGRAMANKRWHAKASGFCSEHYPKFFDSTHRHRLQRPQTYCKPMFLTRLCFLDGLFFFFSKNKIRSSHDGTYEPSQSSKSSVLQAPGKVDAAAPSKHSLQRRSPSSSVLEKLKTSHGTRVRTPSVGSGTIVSKFLWLR